MIKSSLTSTINEVLRTNYEFTHQISCWLDWKQYKFPLKMLERDTSSIMSHRWYQNIPSRPHARHFSRDNRDHRRLSICHFQLKFFGFLCLVISRHKIPLHFQWAESVTRTDQWTHPYPILSFLASDYATFQTNFPNTLF